MKVRLPAVHPWHSDTARAGVPRLRNFSGSIRVLEGCYKGSISVL